MVKGDIALPFGYAQRRLSECVEYKSLNLQRIHGTRVLTGLVNFVNVVVTGISEGSITLIRQY